jgi:hypothetical protein
LLLLLQVIATYAQCGGSGGSCAQASACVDGPFPGTACEAGSTCQRASQVSARGTVVTAISTCIYTS